MDNKTLISVMESHRQIVKVDLPKASNADDFWGELTKSIYGDLPALENDLDGKIRDSMRSFASQSLDLLTKQGKLLKRFGNWFKSCNGFKLDDKYMGIIGDKLQYYLSSDSRSFYIDFTDCVNWNDGMFGKSNSCWWGCYSESQDVYNKSKSWTIRFYDSPDDTQGIGRCFIVPKYNVLLCFNAYGLERAKISKVIKAVFDSHGIELHYTRAEIFNSHNDNIPYINNDSVSGSSGTFILYTDESDVRAKYNIDMECQDDDRHTCEGCGRRIDSYNCIHTNDSCWCDSCHSERFSNCDRCEEDCNREDVSEIRGHHRYSYICSYCADSIGAAMCEDCEKYSCDYVVTEDNNSTWCDHCAGSNCGHCDHCDRSYDAIEYHNSHTHQICATCNEVLEHSDSESLYDHNQENHPELIIELEYQ